MKEDLFNRLNKINRMIESYNRPIEVLISNFYSIIKSELVSTLINYGCTYSVAKKVLKSYNLTYQFDDNNLINIKLYTHQMEYVELKWAEKLNQYLDEYFSHCIKNKNLLEISVIENFKFV